jgi:hypothetical protein
VAVAALLNAAFDRVAETDDDQGEYRVALWSLIDSLRTG